MRLEPNVQALGRAGSDDYRFLVRLEAEPAEKQRVLTRWNPLEHEGAVCAREGRDVRSDHCDAHTANRLAVVGLAKTLSRELAPEGITVNNVCPGNIATERLMALIEERAARRRQTLADAVSLEESRVPMGFLGEAADVASLVAFLASDRARYITGTTIQVDGGSTTAVF